MAWLDLQLSNPAEGRLRTEGVRFRTTREVHTAHLAPQGEAILASGALGSPEILMRSGLGPEDSLRAAGVAPKHVLPGVGQNLQDHLQLRAKFAVDGAATRRLPTRRRGPY